MKSPIALGPFRQFSTRFAVDRLLRPFRNLLLSLLAATLAGWTFPGLAASPAGERIPETMPLPAPGESVVTEHGTHRSENFELAAGDLLYLLVSQQGLDVRLRLTGPNDFLMEVDSPSGVSGPEELIAVASEPGPYRLEILATTGTGAYSVSRIERRPASSADLDWARGAESFLRGRALLKDKKPAAALEAFQAAMTVWQELGIGYRLAATHEQIGNALVQVQEMGKALEEFARAADGFRILGEERQLATNLQKLATYQLQMGRFTEAVPHLEEALPLFRHLGFEHGEGLCLARLGYAHLGLGRPREALSYLEESLAIAERLGQPPLHGAILVDLGKALLNLNRSQEAFDRYTKAAEVYQAHNADEGLEIALIGLANVAIQMEETALAEDAARRVESLVAQGGASIRIRAAALVVTSNVLRLRQQWPEARNLLQEALTLVATTQEPLLKADILLNLGHMETLLGSPERGLALQEQAFSLFEQAGIKTGMASSRARAAEALMDLGRFEEAWAKLQGSLEEVERFRSETARRDQRLAFFGSFRQDYFELARRALLKLHARNPTAGFDRLALENDDRRRSRELLDSIRSSSPKLPSASPAEIEKSKALQDRLRAMAVASTGILDKEVSLLLNELHQLRSQERLPEPEEPVAQARIEILQRNLLDENTLLLVYALGKKEAVLWSVGRESLRAVPLEDAAALPPLIRDFVDLHARWPDRQVERRNRVGQELSKLLLEPVADLLGNKRLLIVADSELQTLPFAALPQPQNEDPRAYLALSHEIVLLPSVAYLHELTRRSSSLAEKPRIAVFADPVFQSSDPRLAAAATAGPAPAASFEPPAPVTSRTLEILTQDFRFSLPPERLLWSGVEGKNILAASSGNTDLLLTGEAANLETFKTLDWSKFQVLHFATHAYLHTSPELSSLALSLVDEKGNPREGLLLAADISAMNLPLDLVVLSACQTATGVLQPGEGVLGLTWAFLDAGAKRVVSSLWKVGDRSTSQLMTFFYEELLQNKKTPAAALRNAQIRMSNLEGSTPADWAGFVIQGDWR